jgi:lysophospholipase L1-like esterase
MKHILFLLFFPLYCFGQSGISIPQEAENSGTGSVIKIPQHIISDVAGGSVVRLGGYKWDAHAISFLATAGITDATQKKAVNELVKDLKAINLIQAHFVSFDTNSVSVIKAIYPFIGSDSVAHKYNLLSTSYKLTFHGTLTHDANGVDPNGTTGYADTHIIPNTALSTNSSSLGYFPLESSDVKNKTALGSYDATNFMALNINNATQYMVSNMYNGTVGQGFLQSTAVISQYYNTTNLISPCKLYISTRTGSSHKIFYNANLVGSATATGAALPTKNLFMFGYNNNGAGATTFMDRKAGFAFVGKGLTDAAITAFNTAVNKYMTALNRNPKVAAIICVGNSITLGTTGGATPWQTPLLAKYSFPSLPVIVNYGVGGRTLATMITSAAAQEDAVYNSKLDYNILLIEGGVNDFGSELGTTKEQIYDRLKTYCQGRKAVGYKVYAFTLLPQSSASYAARTDYENERQWFNTQVRTDLMSSGFIDGVIDVGADPTIGCDGCQNTSYYNADKIHPSTTGNAIIANIVYNAITDLK